MSDPDRYIPPSNRAAAVELILASFVAAAPERLNVPPEVTMAQAALSLYQLGVTQQELESAAHELGIQR